MWWGVSGERWESKCEADGWGELEKVKVKTETAVLARRSQALGEQMRLKTPNSKQLP